MKIAAQNINERGITLDKHRMQERMIYYDRLYGTGCFGLYNLGFTSNPSVVTRDELYGSLTSALKEEFPNDFRYLISWHGSRVCYIELADYAIQMSSNETFKETVKYIKWIAEAFDAMDTYNFLLNNAKFPKRDSSVTVKSRLKVTTKVENASTLPLDKPCSLYVFAREQGSSITRCDLSSILLKHILLDAGYTEEEYTLHKETGQAFLIDGLTAEDELKYVRLLADEMIKADGKFAKGFCDRVDTYYADFYNTTRTSTVCISYAENIFVNALKDCVSYVTEFRDKSDNIIKDLYVSYDSVYFETRGEDNSAFSTYSIGAYAVDSTSGKSLGLDGRLNGFHGEFINVKDMDKLGYYGKGCPIPVGSGFYYPLYRVFLDGSDIEVKPAIRDNISFNFSSFDELCKRIGVGISSENVEAKLVDMCGDVDTARVILALLNVESGNFAESIINLSISDSDIKRLLDSVIYNLGVLGIDKLVE